MKKIGNSARLARRRALLIALPVALYGCAPENGTDPAGDSQAASQPAPDLCLDAGPQTPRDIGQSAGLNPVLFELAPESSKLNLCNIHTHTNAEHKGPGFSVFAGPGASGGYQCNETAELSAEELAMPSNAPTDYKGVKPGDTIEVHWVHSSCPVSPGGGLGSCVTDTCTNPKLRVETQVFLLVNDSSAADFLDYVEESDRASGFYQPKQIPTGTGEPVVFRGSTTGPSYNQSKCSAYQVTWSVRPMCQKLDVNSLHQWAADGNVFNETQSHGVRELVTAPELLSPIG